MESNFERTLNFILKAEGNKVHKVKDDAGGLTSAGGLTLRTMKALNIDPNDDGYINEEDTYLVDEKIIREAFREHFWDAIHGDDLPGGFDLMYADIAWNSGAGRARQFICEGYKTLEALLARRLRYYRNIVTKKPSQKKFLKGWENRANLAYEEALECET